MIFYPADLSLVFTEMGGLSVYPSDRNMNSPLGCA